MLASGKWLRSPSASALLLAFGAFCQTPIDAFASVADTDFAKRCAQPNVVKCVGFDKAADVAGRYGSNSGIMAGHTLPALDTSVKASGGSSLKFTIPSNSPADSSGSYFTNFSTN